MITDDIAAYLATQGVGTVGTDIVKGFLPDTPGDCVAVYQKGGYAPIQPFSIERPQLHVVVRGSTYDNAQQKANDIYVILHRAWELTLSGRRYLYIRALTSPTYLYTDYSERDPHVYFAIDFIVTKENE